MITERHLLIQLPPDAKEITRETVEKVAQIMGEGSSSADALKRADEHPGPARFWYSPSVGMLSVELLKGTLQ